MPSREPAPDVLRIVLSAAVGAGLDPLAAERLDRTLRAELGGERFYIQSRPSLVKAGALADALASGLPLHQAFAAAGVRRSYGFRLIHRPSFRRY
jgi:hypothetical protein